METTLFQKIIDREIPATIEHEDEFVIVIRDIQPTAPVHLLIIPKKVIPTINDVTPDDKDLIGHMTLVAQAQAKKFGLSERGYRLTTNVNSDGGQTVFHLHMHLLGGQPLGRMNSASSGHSPKSGVLRGTLLEAGFLILVSLGLAIGFNAMNPKSITWMKKEFEKVVATDDEIMGYLDTPTETTTPPIDVKESETAPIVAEADKPLTPDLKKPEPVEVEPKKPTFEAQPGMVREINIKQFKKLMAGPHYIIDARTAEAYSKGHIGNAVNFFGGEAEALIEPMLSQVPTDRVIMIYCDGGPECELSHHIADVLKQFGYGPMFIYMGGWNEWNAQK